MISEQFLNLEKNFDQRDSQVKKPSFESVDSLLDWKNPAFNEPRSFTLKNIRDIFFGLMNQSKTQQRTCDSEDHITKLYSKCKELLEITENIDTKMNKQKDDLNAQHNIFFKKFTETVEAHEEKFSISSKKIRNNTEQLETHSKDLEFLKAFRIDTGNRFERNEKNIKKNLINAQDDTNKLRDELS